jgi:hypothetical protein
MIARFKVGGLSRQQFGQQLILSLKPSSNLSARFKAQSDDFIPHNVEALKKKCNILNANVVESVYEPISEII